jgi:uncharacterized protein YkvS
MQKVKDANKKTNSEQLFDWEQKSFASSTYLDPPASKIPDNAIVRADDCKVYAEWIEGRTGTKLWGDALLPTLPGRDDYEATKTGFVITITAGLSFTATDVDNYFIWPDGTHEQIAEVLTNSSVRVRTDTPHSAATAGSPGKIRGPINGAFFHSSQRLIVIQVDTRFFYSTIALTSWTEIYRKCYDEPLSDISVFSEYADFLFAFNTNGIYKIDLGLTMPEFYKANAAIPENTITEVTESTARPYVRRYLYAMTRMTGVGDRDRDHGGVIKLESGTPEPDPDLEYQDFRAVSNPFPFGAEYGTYQELECANTTRTFTEWTSTAAVYNYLGFNIVLNGATRNVQLYRSYTNALTTWEDIATYIQERIRVAFSGVPTVASGATCEWDSGHFVITSGKEAARTVGYVAAFGGITPNTLNIGDDTYLNGRDPAAGGNGTINTVQLTTVIGPLTCPANEQQWTHYSLYGTKDVGSAYGVLNDKNSYVWLGDVPVSKAFSAARDIAGTIQSSTGFFEVGDVGSVIEFADGTTDTIATYVSTTEVTGTPGAAVAAQGAAIGAGSVATATQAGTTVTRTSGDVFAASMVGKTLTWADGYYVYVVEFVDNNTVIVAENQNRVAQGLCWDPTFRNFNDHISDTFIENRYKTHQLQQRFWQELPIINTGIVVPGFMFCAIRDENKFYYSQMGLGREYLAGYYNPAYQYESLDDSMTAFANFPDMCVLYCSRSTKRIPVNISSQIIVPGTNAVVTVISGVTSVDAEIGCLDFGGIRDIGEGQQILVTSEPGVRIFDGYRYSQNLAIDGSGNGYMLNELRLLQAALASSYDPIEGYVIWGTNKAL